MKNVKPGLFLLAAFFMLAFSFPWDATQQKDKKDSDPQNQAAAAQAGQNNSVNTADFSGGKAAIQKNAPDSGSSAPVKASGKVPTPMQTVKAAAGVSGQPDIGKIQKQIQDIIRINENLKYRYQDQAAEIQHITEQARIHEKILENMNRMKTPGANANEAIIQQEKLRLIQQATQSNQQYIQDLEHRK